MRAVSFLPAATRTILDLGLGELLHGVTFECPAERPRIVRSRLEGLDLDGAAIDRLVNEAAARGETLYSVDDALLAAAAPDVVFTQHVCDVCQIGTAVVERAVARLPHVPRVVPLVPRRLDDVIENVRTIAGALGRPEAAEVAIAAARARMDAIARAVDGAPRTRAVLLEWIEPPYHCGHWIPDQIARAGGHDPLGAPGGYSVPIEWSALVAADPEVLIAAPCGWGIARAQRELAPIRARPGFAELRAVRSGRAFVVDASLFTQPSLSTQVRGIEVLAHLFHPARVAAPDGLDAECAPL